MDYSNNYNFSNSIKPNDDGSKPKSKKRFLLFGSIFIAAVITILYVSNLMYVNKLMKEVHYLNKDYKEIVNTNEILQARLARLESPDRIIPYATDRLGMIVSDKAPIIINKPKR